MEQLIGMGEGRIAFALHWGKVEKVYRGTPKHGALWLVDVRLTTGAPVEKAKVVGNRLPLVHSKKRQSWGLVGYIGANVHDPVFIPATYLAETDAEIRTHDLLDQHEFFTFHIENQNIEPTPEAPNGTTEDAFGVYTIRAPGNAPPNEDNGHANRYFQIVSAPRKSPGSGGKVQMMGGGRRGARAGATGDGGPGDFIVIDQSTSPAFVAWQQQVTAAINALIALVSAAGVGQAALAAQTGALTGWAGAAAAAIPTAAPVVPPAPAALGAPPAPIAPPLDGVPGVPGNEPVAPAEFQTVGQIVTGSVTVTGA